MAVVRHNKLTAIGHPSRIQFPVKGPRFIVPRLLRFVALFALILAILVSGAALYQHRHPSAWRFSDYNPILAFNLGGVASDVNGQASEDEQRNIDMLDMSLDKLRSVYYKPVD